MNIPLIFSLIGNILLFLLFLFIVILFVTYSGSSISTPNICPVPPSYPPPSIDTTISYSLKTLSGKYVQSCFQCLPSPVSCFQQGIIAAEQWNGDTINLIPLGNQFYNIQINVQNDPSGVYFLTLVPSGGRNIVCLTQNSNQRGATFELVSYTNTNQQITNATLNLPIATSIYQIGTITNTFLGEGSPSCLTAQGVPIEDGYNITPNAPRGMNENSFFLLLPNTINPIPINPIRMCTTQTDCMPTEICQNGQCVLSIMPPSQK
jgi:hypothetical protein